MAVAIRVVMATLAGVAAAFVLVITVELLSAVVHPTPPGFTGTHDEMCAHVARYPQWVLAAVVVAWSATALVSVWIATRLGWRLAGAVVSVVLLAMAAFNVAMLPYPPWFKLAAPAFMCAACWWGIRVASRGPRRAVAD